MEMKILKYVMTLLLMAVVVSVAAQTQNVRTMHKVEKSETVFGIAKKYGITIEDLIAVNPEMKQQGYELKAGDTLCIPYAKNQTPQSQTTAPVTNTVNKTATAVAW